MYTIADSLRKTHSYEYYRMGQDMSDSFGSIGEILEAILVDEHENLDSSDRAKTHILMNKFSGQRAPFRDFVMESHLKYKAL